MRQTLFVLICKPFEALKTNKNNAKPVPNIFFWYSVYIWKKSMDFYKQIFLDYPPSLIFHNLSNKVRQVLRLYHRFALQIYYTYNSYHLPKFM